MGEILKFIKATLAGGFFVFLPVVIVFLVLESAVTTIVGLVGPVANALPVETVGGVEVAFVVAISFIIVFCFVAGLVLQTGFGSRVYGWFERTVLNRIPGYTLVKNITERFAGSTDKAVVLARVHSAEAWVVGLLVADLDEDMVAVFVPMAPTPTVGNVHVVARKDVRVLDATTPAVINCLMQWGVGAEDVLKAPFAPISGK